MQEFLLVIEASGDNAVRARIAAAFAAAHRATIRAIIVTHVLNEPSGLETLLDARMDALRKHASDLQAQMQSDFGMPAALLEVSASRAVVDLASAMRGADFVICAPPQLDRSALDDDIFEAALFVSGRPVLLIPENVTAPISTAKVTIAWKECREATRALYDAMPLLTRAENVTILSVAADETGLLLAQRSLERVGRILLRNGVKSVEKMPISEQGGVGKTIAREAASSDLLVMGGYGHWRWSEILFGGVTRHILQNISMPVLMAR